MTLTAMRFHGRLLMQSVLAAAVLVLVCGGMAHAADQPEPDKPLKESLAVDLGDNVTMEFVLVKPGSFMMGEKDTGVRKVTLTRPFYLGKCEVTQEQWEKVMGGNPSHFKGAKNPVDTVSWDDCQIFLAKLKDKVPGHQFALPTEAQWEYACRAGTTADPGTADDPTGWKEYAWGSNNSDNMTHPVGGKKPNPWGLYDMHGNVWEWCADRYGAYPENAQTDPTGPATGRTRVLRGGSWGGYIDEVRSASRRASRPAEGSNFIGLRCVVAVGEAPGQ